MSLGNDPLWTGLGLVAPLGARVDGGLPRGVSGISLEAGTLAPGDLYFAIVRDGGDGYDEMEAAFEAGAAAAVIDEAHADAFSDGGPFYIVRDVGEALAGLARAARARTQARVIAIAGAVGDGSTKEALRLALLSAGTVHASGSLHDPLDLPLTLARMPRTTRFLICEIGADLADEAASLAEMARPHVAIAPRGREPAPQTDAQATVLAGLEPGGVAIIARDDPCFERLDRAVRASHAGHISTFGADEAAAARLLDVKPAETHAQIEASVLGRQISFRLGVPDRRHAENALAVLLAAHALGADIEIAAASLAFVRPEEDFGEPTFGAHVEGPHAAPATA